MAIKIEAPQVRQGTSSNPAHPRGPSNMIPLNTPVGQPPGGEPPGRVQCEFIPGQSGSNQVIALSIPGAMSPDPSAGSIPLSTGGRSTSK
jgi:hypothetical protein